MKKCCYRNCDKDIYDMRSNAKYCCKNHRELEYKMSGKVVIIKRVIESQERVVLKGRRVV